MNPKVEQGDSLDEGGAAADLGADRVVDLRENLGVEWPQRQRVQNPELITELGSSTEVLAARSLSATGKLWPGGRMWPVKAF